MHNIGIQHFRLVKTIVAEGSLTKAADVLFLTQSALSHQLKDLEKELDTTIFNRKGKRLELSDEGTRFLSSAEKILNEIKSLETDIDNFKQGKVGKLRITTQCYTAYHWLPRIMKYYKAKSPGIDIHVLSAASHLPLDYLLNGELDVAIVRSKIDNPEIFYERIFDDKLFAIVSKDHRLAKKKSVTIEDFEDEELFLHFNDPASGTVPIIENLLRINQVKPRHLHRIHYTDAIIEMVNANIGISTLADWIVEPYLKTKDIVAVPLPPEVAKRTWYAATCKKTLPIQHFLDSLKCHFSEMTMKMETVPNEYALVQ